MWEICSHVPTGGHSISWRGQAHKDCNCHLVSGFRSVWSQTSSGIQGPPLDLCSQDATVHSCWPTTGPREDSAMHLHVPVPLGHYCPLRDTSSLRVHPVRFLALSILLLTLRELKTVPTGRAQAKPTVFLCSSSYAHLTRAKP